MSTHTKSRRRATPTKTVAKPAPYRNFKYLKGKELVPDPFELGL